MSHSKEQPSCQNFPDSLEKGCSRKQRYSWRSHIFSALSTLFNHRCLSLRVLLRTGLDSASLLTTSSKDAPSGTTSLRNTPVLPIASLRVKTLIRSLTMSELTPSSRATSDSLSIIGDST